MGRSEVTLGVRIEDVDGVKEVLLKKNFPFLMVFWFLFLMRTFLFNPYLVLTIIS